ncbi:autotransporter outer membrane beta-barrel domain-containing protein [Novosphingobium pentaromativorans]|uniref:Autotransporter beta-domain-containing protein n=1 Tax=Novosphingobium pentaromativorans US6-1 TaxID=1088721 RepID=G6EGW4_9SPHN|nr:autotransporter outer membrane beta-barrel domain-containing protein [Novosphingobium pentaromativorans]AIT82044.1 transporter [Novosphingobium pentaromativorans US6-1]EHJ59253.1 autotransporter beta-domain-containing protein [Novosphingobium pentaromativorans US6-1]
MSRYLLASTALLALATAAQTTAAHAEDVTTKKTAPLRTSTIKNGAADAINITKDGSVVLTAGTAVTMDSDHKVTNAGALSVSNANGAVGIVAESGTSGEIVNTGTITIDEPYEPADDDKDGDLDGPFALGSNRYGIRTLGAHSGKIVNSGKIVIEGNDSAGIALGGPLTGDFVQDGQITVLGDRVVGIAAGDIDGNVRLAGSVSVQGKDAVGAHFTGDVDGAMVVQGTILATGYRYTTVPSDASKLDADDLLQGGSALVIEGDVSGGIVLAVAPKDNDPDNADEDGDGIEDAKEGSAKVVSYGKAPAMVIGAADRDVAIGPVAGTASQYGLQIDGSVEARGLYAGIDATGLAIGGRGGAVTIANGIGIAGSVAAVSNGANATALNIGAGTSTPELRVSGSVAATGGNADDAQTSAIHIAAGAEISAIRNSGTIEATASGEKGSASAIVDKSGTVELIENSGSIVASGAKADSGRNIAIDLSAATNGVTVKQTQVASGYDAPSILGDVRLGSGSDRLELADGSLTGNVTFGIGNNALALSGDAAQTGDVAFGSGTDTMTLAGSSTFSGKVDFGGGADALTLAGTARFSGSLANAANLAIDVEGGMLDVRTPAQIGSLDVSKDGILAVTLNKEAGSGSAYTVAGTASFEEGATLSIRLADVSTAEGSYQVLTAGAIEGLDGLETATDLVPFMFKAALDEDAAANTIVVDVARRSKEELGLNRSQASAYDAVFVALGKDRDVADVFLGITDGDQFRQTVGMMLPDHAGGSFEGISLGARTIGRQLMDPQGPLVASGPISVTVNLAFWGSDKDTGSSAAYDLNGYAWSLTGEYETGIGRFGATAAYLWNRHTNGAASEVKSGSYELAAHWRGNWGAFTGFSRASYGHADFDSTRNFVGMAGEEDVKRKIEGDWNGNFATFAAGASAEGGSRFLYFRPAVTVDYVRLKEGGYTETGGGEALDMTVGSRKSDELGLNGGVTLGADLMGMSARDENWFRIETEGGWREILSGGLGTTTAHFEDGTPFSLGGEKATGGWFARLRTFGGSAGFVLGGELSAEDRHDHVNLALRGSVKVAW